MEDPHVQLMLRFQAGDEQAFRELFGAYKIPLLKFIYRFCQDRRVAEELTQEVFLRIYKTARSYRPDAKFSTWIYRIATNICLNEIRTGRNRYELDLGSLTADEEGRPFEIADTAGAPGMDENLAAGEREIAVRRAIAALPAKQRMALLLSVYEQLSYKEIGTRISCSEGAVKSIIHRAKVAVRDMLREHLGLLL